MGWYKYDREAFFLQTGTTSTLSKSVDALCKTHAQLLQRKSDCNLPRLNFTDGIRLGKLQAHEMSGVILLLALTLRSWAGRNLILETAWGDAKKLHFQDEAHIRDWIHMLELELMFEQWLRQDVLQVFHLERAKSKLKELMALRKHIGKREKGMGYNTVNFHATLHLPQLALDLCAPGNWDTQSDESHHRIDKKTARRTNMQESTFNISTAKKTVLREAIELGQQELAGNTRWGYHYKDEDGPPKQPFAFDPETSGPYVTYKLLPGSDDEWVPCVQSKAKGKEKYVYDENTHLFLASLANDFHNEHGIKTTMTFGKLTVFSEDAINNRQIYYAQPYQGGKAWQDWAIFDLSDNESMTDDFAAAHSFVPAHIKCFVDLSDAPPDNFLLKEPGLYAIIERLYPTSDEYEVRWSDLFEPQHKKPSQLPDAKDDWNHQELVNLNRLLRPAAVVPDLENPNNRAFLRIVQRKHWAGMFEDWLETEDIRRYE